MRSIITPERKQDTDPSRATPALFFPGGTRHDASRTPLPAIALRSSCVPRWHTSVPPKDLSIVSALAPRGTNGTPFRYKTAFTSYETVPRTRQFVSVMAVSPVQERYKMGQKWHTLSHSSQTPANTVPGLADAKLARSCAGANPGTRVCTGIATRSATGSERELHGIATGMTRDCHGNDTTAHKRATPRYKMWEEVAAIC